MRESTTAIVARNARWSGTAASEPYEAGWANEAIFFVRALKPAIGGTAEGRVEISADGMRWAAEGGRFAMPTAEDEVAFVRVAHFGNWLRVATDLPEGAEHRVLVTLHLKG